MAQKQYKHWVAVSNDGAFELSWGASPLTSYRAIVGNLGVRALVTVHEHGSERYRRVSGEISPPQVESYRTIRFWLLLGFWPSASSATAMVIDFSYMTEL